MTRMLVTIVLLSGGVALIAQGIHESSLIMVAIGGFCLGIYNGMMHEEK